MVSEKTSETIPNQVDGPDHAVVGWIRQTWAPWVTFPQSGANQEPSIMQVILVRTLEALKVVLYQPLLVTFPRRVTASSAGLNNY